METETILRAIENGKLNDAREGISDIMLNKIADSLEERKQSLGDNLVGVCEDCDEVEEGSKKEYEAFFKKAMKKFGISSPADLKSEEEKKKFFDYVDKNYKGEKNEETEIEEGNEFSKALRTARKEGKSTFNVDGKEYTVEDYDEDELDEIAGAAIKVGAKVAKSKTARKVAKAAVGAAASSVAKRMKK